jgi:hypothetical protein
MAKYDLISNSRIGPAIPSAPDASHEHMPSMPFDPSMTAVAQGHVEGAWSIEALGEDWTPEKVFVLPEGATMKVDKGTAIRVQSSDGWRHCEFPQTGVLHGPAVWSLAEATSDRDLLSGLECRSTALIAQVFGWVGGTGVCAISMTFAVRHYRMPPGTFEENVDLAALFAAGTLALSGVVGLLIGRVANSLTERAMDRWSPRTITSVNQRVSKTLRMPRSVFLALGARQPHLKLLTPEQPMDDLDLEIRGHLERYYAQRAKLVAKRISGSPLMEHTSAMLEEISLRLGEDNAALRRDDLRRTYLKLIQRAEADVTLALEKKDSEAADALIEDMTALLRQMDRHKR